MLLVILVVVLLLVLAGCGAVVWASRGGPRWVRGIALGTLLAGEAARTVARSNRRDSRGGGED